MNAPPFDPALPVVCIDFDGVLAEGTWPSPAIGAPIEKGLRLLCDYAEAGAEVRILTARPASHWPKIVEWLYIQNVGHLVYDVTNIKLPASVYVDDRAWRFEP